MGDLDIEVGLQRVTRGGAEVPLPKLSYDLLMALVQAAPNLVSHEELLARVWPGLIVTDKTVSQRVKLLRDALGDDPEAPRYVAGLRGRGYRIVAPVTAIEATAADAVVALERESLMDVHPPLAEVAPRRWLWLTSAVAVIGLVASTTWWLLGPTGEPRAAVASSSSGPITTIAVLPFRSPSGAEADAYLGTGIAEAVLERLSRIPGIATIARDSAFKLAGGPISRDDLAQRLGARYLLEGDVEQSVEGLRIAARLTDVATATQLWAGAFDRPVTDIFDIQERIATEAATALRATESPQDTVHRRPRLTANVDAYLAYLRGRALLGRWTIVGAEQAKAEFATAVDLDPNFAAAYASLYEARLLAADRAAGGASPTAAATFLGEQPLAAVRSENQPLIERAIALDPECGAAYFARAIWAADDSATREEDFARGMPLDPSNGRGITAYAEYLDRIGRADEAKRLLERALALDPLSPRAHFRLVMRQFPRDASGLESGMRRVLDIDPDYQPALQRYAKYRWYDGEMAEAARILEHSLALDPANPWITHTLVAVYLDSGDADSARALVATAKHPEIAGDLLLAQYDRDDQTAGAAAHRDAAFASGVPEAWGVFEAVRDSALESREIEPALIYLQAHTQLLGAQPRVNPDNFRAAPVLAHLLLTAGRNDEARALLTATIQWIDDVHLPRLGSVYALRTKATALLLLGEQALALDALDASFRSNDYVQWWYTLEHDPLWQPLRANSRFGDITTRVRVHVAEQNAALAALRKQGLVPLHARTSR